MEVLKALEEVSVLPSITTNHGDLLGFGLGGQHRHLKLEGFQGYRLMEGRGRGRERWEIRREGEIRGEIGREER